MSFYQQSIVFFLISHLAMVSFAGHEKLVLPAVKTSEVIQSVGETTKVNINKAALKDLLKIKGLTKVKAKSILSYRKKHGDFTSLNDLRLVRGFKKIKDEQLRTLQAQMSVT